MTRFFSFECTRCGGDIDCNCVGSRHIATPLTDMLPPAWSEPPRPLSPPPLGQVQERDAVPVQERIFGARAA